MLTRKQPNPFLKFRPDVSDEAILSAKHDMMDANEYPEKMARPDEQLELEDGTKLRMRFNVVTGMYLADVTMPNGNTTRLTAATKLEIIRSLTRANTDIEAENQAEIAANAQPEPKTDAQRENWDWLDNYRMGQFFTNLDITDEVTEIMNDMLLGKLGSMKLPMTACNLEAAFTSLWDSNDKFAGYIDIGLQNAEFKKRQAAADAEQAAIRAARTPIVEEPATRNYQSQKEKLQKDVVGEDFETVQALRNAKTAAETKDIMKRLRHKALFQK